MSELDRGPRTVKSATAERRDMSPQGVARRARFESSLDLLRALGLSSAALEHYRRRARKTRKLPHVLVRDMAEEVAQTEIILYTIGSRSGRPA
jgi:hypothetical protein